MTRGPDARSRRSRSPRRASSTRAPGGGASGLRFASASAIFWHLLRHGRRYDAVHTASFPYFHLIGARLALRLSRSRALADRRLARGLGPRLLALLSRARRRADRLRRRAPLPAPSRPELHLLAARGGAAARVRSPRPDREADRRVRRAIPGPSRRSRDEAAVEPEPPLVVSAGRHIPEKRVPAIPAGDRAQRAQRVPRPPLRDPRRRPGLRGDPRARSRELGLTGRHRAAGRVDHERAYAADRIRILPASPLRARGLRPRRRRGGLGRHSGDRGARARRTPATELVEDGVERLRRSARPTARGARRRDRSGGRRRQRLRATTLDWYERHRTSSRSRARSPEVEASYARAGGAAVEGLSLDACGSSRYSPSIARSAVFRAWTTKV